MHRFLPFFVFVLMHFVGAMPAIADDQNSITQQCLLSALRAADKSSTAENIRALCQTETEITASDILTNTTLGPIELRIAAEDKILERPFVLTAHHPNYVLPYTYNNQPNKEAFELIGPEQPIDSAEAQFQVSFKFPLAQHLLSAHNDLFFSFTTRAWWQLYNNDISSPFRETDYEPEIFFRHYGGPKIGPLKVGGWDVGLAHQSNGRSEPLSRSWNRINANLALETGKLAIALHSWYRIPENEKRDDNPDLYKYLGYGDIRFLYSRKNQVFTAMVRPGTKKGAAELTWSIPLWQDLRLYFIYFDGYGESLLDYNHHVQRIGIGVGLSDYLETREYHP